MMATYAGGKADSYGANASGAGRRGGAVLARRAGKARTFRAGLPFLMLLMFGPMDFLKAVHGWQHVSVSVRAAWSRLKRRTIGNRIRSEAAGPTAPPLFPQEF